MGRSSNCSGCKQTKIGKLEAPQCSVKEYSELEHAVYKTSYADGPDCELHGPLLLIAGLGQNAACLSSHDYQENY